MSVTYNVYRNGEKVASGLNSKTYTDSGLQPNTEYTYQVSAENLAGESDLTPPLTVKTDYSAANSIVLSQESLELAIGESIDITVEILPKTAKQEFIWETLDDSVATYSDGKIHAVGEGETEILFATPDKGITTTCSIKVIAELDNEDDI